MEASTVGVALAPYGQSFSVHETVAKLIDLLSSIAEFRKSAGWNEAALVDHFCRSQGTVFND